MTPRRFTFRSRIDAPASDAFAWLARAGAFERLTPPWDRTLRLEGGGALAEGARVTLEVITGPFRRRWVARHFGIEPGRQFCDEQVEGPFRSWVHTHRVEPAGASACELVDDIRFELPFGALGDAVGGAWIDRTLARTFRYRHARMASDLRRLRETPGLDGLRVGITGASGLIGSALVPFFTTGGAAVTTLARDAQRDDLSGLDAIVHLAGENVAARRWSAAQKSRILRSRADGTRALAERLTALARPPRVLVCASACGFYGSRGDEPLDESSAPGSDFLAGVCRAWELASEPARQAGVRVVHLRFGMVLSPAGGALPRLLLPLHLGVLGRIGSGRQWWRWISIDDAVAVIHAALLRPSMEGPVNAVAPSPVTQAELTRALGRALHRPLRLPIPSFAARLALGELAGPLLLASQRVLPRRLAQESFRFDHPDLDGALRFLLGAPDGENARVADAAAPAVPARGTTR